jgi:hypothetical protein
MEGNSCRKSCNSLIEHSADARHHVDRRNSKNGTPEERAALAVARAADRPRKQRRSKNGSPEQRAAKMKSADVVHLGQRRDQNQIPPPPLRTEEFERRASRLPLAQPAGD